MTTKLRTPALAALLLTLAAGALHAEEARLGGWRGGPLAQRGPLDHLTDAWRMDVQADLNRRVSALLADGRIAPADKAAGVLFQWPAKLIPGAPDAQPDILAYYVDHEPANPGQLRDFMCGTRTYDIPGYDHRGVDISAFPFGWLKMDADEMIVVAAAPGTIIRRDDGAFDRNCGPLGSLPPTTPVNSVYVRHADGSIAWYLHMKRLSLTPKQVGDTVAAGERLGTVGSSGISSGPHLHFEVHTAGGALIDPFAGACNALNADSWWAQQRPYWDPAIVRMTVNTAMSSFGNCNQAAAPNATRHAQPGSTIFPTLFLRDFVKQASIPVRMLRPDGTAFFTTTLVNDSSTDYVASYWTYEIALPADAPPGTWRFQGDQGGRTVDSTFVVTAAPPAKTTVVEYFHAGMGHYFVTGNAAEIAVLDGGGALGEAWERTGRAFAAYAGAGEGAAPVCRFFSAAFAPKSSHFYTPYGFECDLLKNDPAWTYEGIAFHLPLPAADGTCPTGTLPVYRMFNQGQTGAPNHRFTTDYATRLAFAPGQGWIGEGLGATGVGMCAPI